METIALDVPAIADVRITPERLTFVFADGREVSAPLAWYPRLAEATDRERAVFEIWPAGRSAEWPLLDEHIGAVALLKGQPSAEGRPSLLKWRTRLAKRRRAAAEGLDPDEVEPWTRWRPLPEGIDDEEA